MSLLQNAAVAVAQAQTAPGWESATVVVPGAAGVNATVYVLWDEEPRDGVQRRGASVLLAAAECPDEPVDGTTVTLAGDGTVITLRTALRQNVIWRGRGWAVWA